MIKKITLLLIVLIVSVGCLSLVSADNSTNDTLKTTNEADNSVAYITVSSINGNTIKFSDGFTGFCLNSNKKIGSSDKFTSKSTTSSENAVKLAIIECYKQNKENEIGSVVSKVVAKDTSNAIAQKALSSSETVGNSVVVKISNTTEASFNFELLKASENDKSDCIAYTVSLQQIIPEDTLAAGENVSDANTTADGNVKNTSDDSKVQNKSSDEKTTPNKTDEKSDETVVNETNKTIINKTKTTIVNENNTTIINKNNKKITNETPKNATIQETIMRTAGNPIFILAIVIVIIAIVGVAMRKR